MIKSKVSSCLAQFPPTLSLGIILKSDPCFKNIVPKKAIYFWITHTCSLLRIDSHTCVSYDGCSSRVNFEFFSYKLDTC